MSTQAISLLVSLVLMAAIAAIFAAAARSAGRPGAVIPSERSRTGLIYGLLGVGVVVTLASLIPWPHTVTSHPEPDATVNVSGAMWYWDIDRTTLPLGVPVVFNAHTIDVNHGFGVTDSSGRMLFQTQVMPGYVNQVQYIFKRPGTYHVVCLEYCGVAHFAMTSEFTVK